MSRLHFPSFISRGLSRPLWPGRAGPFTPPRVPRAERIPRTSVGGAGPFTPPCVASRDLGSWAGGSRRPQVRSQLWIALAASAALAAGCGGNDNCGPDGAPGAGLVASGDQVSLSFGQLSAGLNNDCPVSDAPAGVTSLTIHGAQTNNPGWFITLCVTRPDLLA